MNATSIPIESAGIEPVGAFFAAVKRPRIDSVDLLRGIIMILMARLKQHGWNPWFSYL